jgi:hypothetical protein
MNIKTIFLNVLNAIILIMFYWIFYKISLHKGADRNLLNSAIKWRYVMYASMLISIIVFRYNGQLENQE